MSEEPIAETLDPKDWDRFRELSHRMVDDIVGHLQGLHDRPVWQQMPQGLAERLRNEPVPLDGIGENRAYDDFLMDVLPYPTGNPHPRFFGWVMGNGIPLANMADMLASAMNPHLAGFNQAPALVEQKVIDWLIEVMGFPPTASGMLESGGTMASILGLAVARHRQCGYDFRSEGLQGDHPPLTVYCSTETHGWVTKGVQLLGIGSNCLRQIPVDATYKMDLNHLRAQVESDLAAGFTPICVVGSVGTVNTGATDDLPALADFCEEFRIWLHLDGAFGALARLSPKYRHFVSGMERADSLAFDLHKWMYLPFELACLLVKDSAAHVETFAHAPSYISGLERGVIAGGLPFADRGIDLSRGFKALKAWMCLRAYGLDQFARVIERNIDQIQALARRIAEHPHLELLAPAPMNLVCFRYRPDARSETDLDELNLELLLRIQESGIAVPSSTVINGKFAIRVCNVNHRCTDADIDLLFDSVIEIGQSLASEGQR